jgi:hypothetical protein
MRRSDWQSRFEFRDDRVHNLEVIYKSDDLSVGREGTVARTERLMTGVGIGVEDTPRNA